MKDGPRNPLDDVLLPCDVKVGGNTFRKGVMLSTFVVAAKHWHREAFPEGYTLTDGQKAGNLALLQSVGALAKVPEGACPDCCGAGEIESALHCEPCFRCNGTGKNLGVDHAPAEITTGYLQVDDTPP